MKQWLILALLLCPPTHAQWGVLFFTPGQRAALDETAAAKSSPAPTSFRFDGELRNSSGRTIRWVNGLIQTSQPLPQGIRPGDRWINDAGKVATRPIGRP